MFTMTYTTVYIGLLAFISCCCAEFCQLEGSTGETECTSIHCGTGTQVACVDNICTCSSPSSTPPTATAPSDMSCSARSTCFAVLPNCSHDNVHCFDQKCQCNDPVHTGPTSCTDQHDCIGHVGVCSTRNTHCYDGSCRCSFFGGVGR